MKDINTVTLAGRLTRDAELRYTKGGTAVLSMAIAVNRTSKDGDKYVDVPSFFDLVLFGKLGEVLNTHLTKGRALVVSGELEQQRWEKDGQSRSKVVIIVNELQMFSNPNAEGSREPQERSSQQYGNTAYPSHYDAPQGPESFDDDIPF